VNLIHSTIVFREKNVIYMTMRVNLIHSKLVFFLNTKTKHTERKKVHVNSASKLHCSRAQCNSLALFACTVQMNCTMHVNTEFCKAAMSYFATLQN
jgi:hypothetical protein